ncbi:MAG: hypothetical protein D4R64_00970 [Porphyromonadaceae bacterium]|nr:MAG: hypothetical protein D4R64_00970 [Porphyromonadaceae bacterium]
MKTNSIDIEKLEQVINPSDLLDKDEERRRQKYVVLVYRSMRKKKMVKRAVWAITSAAAILIFTWILIGPKTTLPDYLSLYMEFYKPAVFQTEYRGKQPEKTLFTEALQQYSEKNYPLAVVIADTLQKQNSQNPDNLLLIASIYQAGGLFEQAEHFYELLHPFGGSYALEANWYLALLTLQKGKSDLCKDYLRKIIKSGAITHLDAAKDLLARF